MTVAVIFVDVANHSQPIPSGIAIIPNAGINLEEIEIAIKEASRTAQTAPGATVETVLAALKSVVQTQASLAAFKVITLETELFV